jgi:hypothetical protein
MSGMSEVWRTELGPYELFKLLFMKKVCRICKMKMNRFKKQIDFQGEFYDDGQLLNGTLHSTEYWYRCPKCNNEISLYDV